MKDRIATVTINLHGESATVTLLEFMDRLLACEHFNAFERPSIYYAAGFASSELVHERKEDN